MNINLLRPQYLNDFFGQYEIVNKLKIYLFSAKKRNSTLDHCLFYGPPGLGKTSLATVIANELNSHLVCVSAPNIEIVGDLYNIISNLNEGDILFIDEIHRLSKEIEEVLYSVMEDFVLNINYKSNNTSKNISLSIKPFTLIGATTNAGLLSNPLRDRFGITFKFQYYSISEIEKIVEYNAKKLNIELNSDDSFEIAKRSRKTPRIANNILKRYLDYYLFYKGKSNIFDFFRFLGIDEDGLNNEDYEIIKTIYQHFKNTPVSLEAIASYLNENVKNIAEINEPYLVYMGYLERTKRGRVLTQKGKNIAESLIN